MDPRLKKGIIYLAIAIFLILLLPFLFTRSNFLGFDFSQTGQIGDTIGGIIGPFIAIVAAILTFAAFWVQYQANQIQIDNFVQQSKDIQIERFESKYFDMIKLHRDNVLELKKEGSSGIDYFTKCLDDLRFTFFFVKRTIQKFTPKKIDFGFDIKDNEKILKIAYMIYWFGYKKENEENIQVLLKYVCTKNFLEFLYKQIKILQLSFLKNKKIELLYKNAPNEMYYNSIKHYPFNEHTSLLGHYYRHLFQTVKFVDNIKSDLINDVKKCDYVKMLRAQLSNNEQILLYYNTLTSFGEAWLKEGNLEYPTNYIDSYLIKYKMIKNIPLPLADIGIKPQDKFAKEMEVISSKGKAVGKIDELFEWHEIINSMNNKY